MLVAVVCGVVFVVVVVVVVAVVVFVELSGALKKEMRKWLNQIKSHICNLHITLLYFILQFSRAFILGIDRQ